MTSYSSNANVQNLVYKSTNSDLDTGTSLARDIATSIINAKLGYTTDLTTVPDVITRCATLLAAGYLASSPTEDISNNGYYKSGMAMLETLGEETVGGGRYNTIVVEGFGRHTDYDDDGTRIW